MKIRLKFIRKRIMVIAMVPMEFIRKHVFEMSQSAFAERTGIAQSTISMMCAPDGREPKKKHMDAVRKAAIEDGLTFNGLPWDDRWFFEIPDMEEAQGQ